MENTNLMLNNQTTNDDEIEIDLRELFGVLLSRWVLIVAVAIICAIASGLVTKLCITPKYQSTTKVYVMSKGSGTGGAVSSALTSLTDMQLGSQIITDFQAMLTCDPIMDKVIKDLDLDMTEKELADTITMDNPANTRILNITVTNTDPYIAKQISQTVAEESTKYIAEIMGVEPSSVFQKAKEAKFQSSPSLKKNVAIATLAGIILICAIIIVRYLLDDTIQSQEDVEKYLGLNTLGIIPVEEGSMAQLKKDKKKRNKELRG